MRHFGGAVVLLLGRTAIDPCVHYEKLIHGGSTLVVTCPCKQARPTLSIGEQFHNGLLALAQIPLLPTIRSCGSRGGRRIEHRRIPEQIRGLFEIGPFWGCGKQPTPNHLKEDMGTANHVDDPGGEPSQVGNGPELYWAGSQTKQTEIDCEIAILQRDAEHSVTVFKINIGYR